MKVSYLEQGQGELVLLIHGVGMCAEAWYPQIEALSQDYHMIAVDMPGHGDSEGFCTTVSLKDYVDWAASVIKALAIERVNVIGHSMGALISAGLAIDYPQLVASIGVFSGVFNRTQQAKEAVLSRAKEIASGTAKLDAPLARWFDDSNPHQAVKVKVKYWLDHVNVEGYAKAYTAFAEGDRTYSSRWDEIQCPVLVLTGEQDLNSSPAMAYEMGKATHHAKVVVLKNEKHMVNLTAPEQVTHEMRKFLENNKEVTTQWSQIKLSS